jgi:sugar lactone lactonase YvrE
MKLLAEGLCFPEGPRWHDGRLFFSDMHGGAVLSLDLDGRVEKLAAVSPSPSGLGFDPEGHVLVVAMEQRVVLRSKHAYRAGEPLELALHADLSDLAPARCNDMVVDALGRAYVGNFGFNLFDRSAPKATCLVLVEADGRARSVAEDLLFPNGMVITPDGGTLIVAETFASRLTAFRIGSDGSLSERRVFAALDVMPDGIALDAEGCVWVANPVTPGGFVRVAEGGEVRERLPAQAESDDAARPRAGYACALGGPDRRTLFMLEAFSSHPKHGTPGNGRIRSTTVAVGGAGLP